MPQALVAYSAQILVPNESHTAIEHYDLREWAITNQPKASGPHVSNDGIEGGECTVHTSGPGVLKLTRGQPHPSIDGTAHPTEMTSSTQDEGAWVWMSLCFLAYTALQRGDDDESARKILDKAARLFERLLRAGDELLLTAAGLMMTILHQHDQEAIAVRIASHAETVVDRVLPDSDPIRTTITYLALSANANGQELQRANLVPKDLMTVYENLSKKYEATHPYVIAALVNYAWSSKWKGDMTNTARYAETAYERSIKRFGELHLQTVVCLSISAGCLTGSKSPTAAYKDIVELASKALGIIHPYTLEALRRLADSLYTDDKVNTALEIDRSVLFGRATVLGKRHKFTMGQKDSYVGRLRQHGRWETAEGSRSPERVEIEEFFDEHAVQVQVEVRRAIDDFSKIEPIDNEFVDLARSVMRTALEGPASSTSDEDNLEVDEDDGT